ncbi:hypothetical protein A3K86_22200 [Photobacterium jeanii]|uniref:Aminoglycoside phosphotransferase domain-containing protein n=1 Tax=Photobacterium jeanii TaxID=858640 RepID=A0A178K2U6_9GAMM|nr:aminoglycoside phosphotransferase family protein [Photobacterium jeanii]OAN11630.1 hypothetical protein A3K86_22200 [Photobacterium jeanii]PST91151.1 aminoglycoside phosphotransferase family protein [Photobacterium jeanii]
MSEQKVVCNDKTVRREAGFWSPAIHALLSYLEDQGCDFVPRVIALGEDSIDRKQYEELSLIEGDVYDYPLTGAIATEEALISVAQLLRRYHDFTEGFLSWNQKTNCYQHNNIAPQGSTCQQGGELVWMLSPKAPPEVICHGDFAPYNVALRGNEVVGVFDFDTAHPAPRIWDLAYAIYCWAPFKTTAPDVMGDLKAQCKRAKIFCQAYGFPVHDRQELVSMMIQRLQALVTFMHDEAAKGNQSFIANLQDGHDQAYLSDIEYLRQNQDVISRLLTVK